MPSRNKPENCSEWTKLSAKITAPCAPIRVTGRVSFTLRLVRVAGPSLGRRPSRLSSRKGAGSIDEIEHRKCKARTTCPAWLPFVKVNRASFPYSLTNENKKRAARSGSEGKTWRRQTSGQESHLTFTLIPPKA